MSSKTLIKLSLFVLVAMSLTPNSSADILSSLCGILNSASAVSGHCLTEFEETLRGYSDYYTKDNSAVLKNLAACCAVGTLRSCVNKNVRAKCGSDAQGVSDSIMNEIIGLGLSAAKIADRDIISDCKGDEWTYHPNSPVCWPIWSLALAGAIIVILLVSCCCVCCIRCIGGSRRRNNGKTYRMATYSHS